jgi:hypothetical protein
MKITITCIGLWYFDRSHYCQYTNYILIRTRLPQAYHIPHMQLWSISCLSPEWPYSGKFKRGYIIFKHLIFFYTNHLKHIWSQDIINILSQIWCRTLSHILPAVMQNVMSYEEGLSLTRSLMCNKISAISTKLNFVHNYYGCHITRSDIIMDAI